MRLQNFTYLAGGALLLALLSGCASIGAITPPEGTSIYFTPYATDEEALAAAETTYEKYLEIMSATMRGAENGDRLGRSYDGTALDRLG